jgi:hypothetical protein
VETNLTRQDKLDWLQHPQTEDLLRLLRLSLTASEAAWSNEEFCGDSLEHGALQNAKALGGVAAIKEMLKYMEE